MRHLLVTNDFPPKVGGIQSYLWELWRRLPADSFSVFTTPYEGDKEWDAQQSFDVHRAKPWWLLPTRTIAREINAMVRDTGADFVVLDPVVPLGVVGPRLDVPFVAVAHGAEYVIPERLALTRPFVARVTQESIGMIAGGAYVESAVRGVLGDRSIPVISIPPGVDADRFRPLSAEERDTTRRRYGVEPHHIVVAGVSRLVPRKGFDRLIDAAAELSQANPDLRVLIAGKGRSHDALQKRIDRSHAPVTLVGRVADADLPAFYGSADIFSMPCHDRWFGLEAEGFGIVFCEASATGVPVVAGASGGSAEAVAHDETGFVVPGRVRSREVARALELLVGDPQLRARFGAAGRQRVEQLFSYDLLADQLKRFLNGLAVG